MADIQPYVVDYYCNNCQRPFQKTFKFGEAAPMTNVECRICGCNDNYKIIKGGRNSNPMSLSQPINMGELPPTLPPLSPN